MAMEETKIVWIAVDRSEKGIKKDNGMMMSIILQMIVIRRVPAILLNS